MDGQLSLSNRCATALLAVAVACGWAFPTDAAETDDAAPQPASAEFASSRFDPPLLEPSAPYAIQQSPRYSYCDTLYKKQQGKDGVLQQIYHATTVIQADPDQLSITELDFSFTIGLPMPTRESPLLITPAFGLDVLQADALDLPDEFYDVSVDFRYLRPVGDYWVLDFAVTPGIYGNTETDEDVFRTQARAVAIYQYSPTAKWIVGGTYLDRDDVEFLPIVGVIWTPTDYYKLDLLFPRPKVAVRAYRDCCSAWWLYLSGELGGGAWGVTRTGGAADVATLTDVRFFFGMEREHDLLSGKLEAGYVFARELEYQSGVGDTELDGAAMFRAVLYY